MMRNPSPNRAKRSNSRDHGVNIAVPIPQISARMRDSTPDKWGMKRFNIVNS